MNKGSETRFGSSPDSDDERFDQFGADLKLTCSNQAQAYFAWVMAAIVGGIMIYIHFSSGAGFDWSSINWKNPDWSNIDWVNFAFEVGPLLIASLLVLWAIRATIRWRKFGNSTLDLKGGAGRVGGVLTGLIRTSVDFRPSGDFKVALRCVEAITSGSGKNRKTRHHTRWENEQIIPSARVSMRIGVPVSFTIPAECMETNSPLARGTVTWKLLIDAPTPGVNYSAEFFVPVERGG